MMKVDVLIMSKAVILAGGKWKAPIAVFIVAPCSMKRDIIWMKTTEDSIVHNHIGSNLKMHFTSST